MSWAQWQGEALPATDDTADLSLYLAATDMPAPRQYWRWELSHYVKVWDEATRKQELDRWLSVEIEDLYFFEEDWRRFSNLTIRADAAWYDVREHTGPYGHGPNHGVRVMVGSRPQEGAGRNDEVWCGHEFVLRFGTRDGMVLPCELDAWLFPEAEYYQEEPQTLAEAERFGEGPPTLRVIAPAVFSGGAVEVPRVKGDPIPHARQWLREATTFEEMHRPRVQWAIRQSLDGKTFVPIVGGRSSVQFSTQP